MGSASVFNPHVLAELKHIRSSSVSADRGARYIPSFAAISTVRRNIFGSPDTEECRIFSEKHFQQQAAKDMAFWGFDFANEVPLPGKSRRFAWEAVPEKPVSRPQKRCFEPEYDNSHLYAEPLEDVRPVIAKDEEHAIEHKNTQKIETVRQSLITDFLKSKKISSTKRIKEMKKMSVTPSPNRTGKITRTRRSIRS